MFFKLSFRECSFMCLCYIDSSHFDPKRSFLLGPGGEHHQLTGLSPFKSAFSGRALRGFAVVSMTMRQKHT